ncbi:ABC transporter substrate-binding protein [Pontibaca methylaminivorans]|uniref:Amino acid/amide ABC transporter substrate-binding protein, HAAT family n=1 Tax=Pontibaca methylaminivorans TaxID=515897 RepID=A0A1R3WVG7_9RHOB|nr:ABC transporter substrate-binding protein [Pontibaca methylaminivorans]SIT82487.1 amino acid/amide ABC transporter substrate-binding protein, HAAT family [Pontibaca methylaminivorans]
MFSKMLKGGLSRRLFLKSSAVTAVGAALPNVALAAEEPIKIGFLAPLTGATAAWGKPGLDGCRIWAERINAEGGVKLADGNHPVEFVAYDEEYDPAKARTGATKLIREDEVKFIMMLGGDPWPGVEPVADRTGMLFSTLLPSDLSPDTTTLVAPCEVHPAYIVTGVDWLARNRPELKTAVICAQDDSLGLPSIATYLAAFEAAGIEQLRRPLLFDASTTDFAPIVTRLMSGNPDIICLDTSYSDYVHPICQQLYQQGYQGQIISATLDFYDQIVQKTSKEFMEGVIFQFPDFDDPAMNSDTVNFKDANGFYEEYAKRFPNQWGAVSWEYAAIMDLWKDAAEKAGSAEPADVLEAMLDGGTGKHAFGDATWWGEELFGINHALVGNWPVVMIEDGKAVIQEFGSIPDWYDQHGDLLIKHMKEYRQMWDQRS